MNSKTIKNTLLLFAALLSQLSISAQTITDVDSLGDIWIVTIDETYSMTRERVRNEKNRIVTVDRDMKEMIDDVKERLQRSEALSKINWSHDRFLFLKSGLSCSDDIIRVANLDTSFIVFVNGEFETFSGQEELASHVKLLMQKMSFRKNYQSFVSQVRALSLKKIIDRLHSIDECKSYRNINILTISDDATDQFDQWNTDYRTLKENDTTKLKYIIQHVSRLLYNPLNRLGGGELNLVWSNEKTLPNIWIYNYVTSQGRRYVDSTTTLFNVTASNGKKVTLKLESDDTICLCRIDSIAINGITHYVGQYFETKWRDTLTYKNRYPRNDVTLYGKIQIEYYDSILGPHYRTVDFIQNSKVLTAAAKTTRNILFFIIAATILGILAYYLLINPRRKLFTVYDAITGRRTTVRRGFRRHWKSDIIPLLSRISSKDGLRVITKKDSKVLHSSSKKELKHRSSELLIVSKCDLELSVESLMLSTKCDDIESYFFTKQDNYPYLLKTVYQSTPEYKLYEMKRLGGLLTKFLANCCLFIYHICFGETHYYHIEKPGKQIYIESERLKGKTFLIEKESENRPSSGCNLLAQQALLSYYGYNNAGQNVVLEYKRHDNNVLVCCIEQDGHRMWEVFLTEQLEESRASIRNIYWVYYFSLQTNSGDYTYERKEVLNYVRHNYHCQPNYLRLKFKWTEGAETAPTPTIFKIREAFSKSFLALVSTDPEHRVIQMYDPFEHGRNKTATFKLFAGHMYHIHSVLLPFPSYTEQYFKKISDQLVEEPSHDIPTTEIVIEGEDKYRVNGRLHEIINK